jgi:hypothetical protein
MIFKGFVVVNEYFVLKESDGMILQTTTTISCTHSRGRKFMHNLQFLSTSQLTFAFGVASSACTAVWRLGARIIMNSRQNRMVLQ